MRWKVRSICIVTARIPAAAAVEYTDSRFAGFEMPSLRRGYGIVSPESTNETRRCPEKAVVLTSQVRSGWICPGKPATLRWELEFRPQSDCRWLYACRVGTSSDSMPSETVSFTGAFPLHSWMASRAYSMNAGGVWPRRLSVCSSVSARPAL